MHKENDGGRNLSAVFQCGILTVIKIFWLTLAENIYVSPSYLSKILSLVNLLIWQIFLLIHLDNMESLLFGHISHEYLCLINPSIQVQEDIGWQVMWSSVSLGFLHKAPPRPNLSLIHADIQHWNVTQGEFYSYKRHWQLSTWYVFRGNGVTWMLTIFMSLLALY